MGRLAGACRFGWLVHIGLPGTGAGSVDRVAGPDEVVEWPELGRGVPGAERERVDAVPSGLAGEVEQVLDRDCQRGHGDE